MKLYHTTRTENRESILKYGLLPKSKNEPKDLVSTIHYTDRIFLSRVKDDSFGWDWLEGWSHNLDIWEVDIPVALLNEDKFSHLNYHYWVGETIPVDKIKLYKHLPIVWTKREMRQWKKFWAGDKTILIGERTVLRQQWDKVSSSLLSFYDWCIGIYY